jgi:hypothetical protein
VRCVPTRLRGLLIPGAVAQVRGARPQRQQAVSSHSWAGRVRGSEGRGTDSEGNNVKRVSAAGFGATRARRERTRTGRKASKSVKLAERDGSAGLIWSDREAGTALVKRELIVGCGTRQLRRLRRGRPGSLRRYGQSSASGRAGGQRQGSWWRREATTIGTRGRPWRLRSGVAAARNKAVELESASKPLRG